MSDAPFWTGVVEPPISGPGPTTVVEVGAATGDNTRYLVLWAERHGAVVHVIDPHPIFDVEEMERDHFDAFVMHRALSLDALPRSWNPDLVLIDGDHNWYTVFHELQLLDRHCEYWPVTLHHDVDRPYVGATCTTSQPTFPYYRQPSSRAGIVLGKSALVAGGMNEGVLNAEHEGGPRNGVLTAIEDFLDTTHRSLELFAVRRPWRARSPYRSCRLPPRQSGRLCCGRGSP